jgi:hypothetical protein
MPIIQPAILRSPLLKMLDIDESNHIKAKEDLSPVTNLLSELLAISQTSNTCSIHEECEVSCDNERYVFEPLLVGTRKLRLSNSLKDNGITDAHVDDPAVSKELVPDMFSHTPLDLPSKRIRLLEIQPARLRTDPIVVTLTDAILDQAPEFAALSYFWGPPRFDADVIVNGARLAITSNLAGSLRRYRQQSSKRTRLLWVDGICINQRDKHELSNQLLLMRRIYQQARMVYIDLGAADRAWYQGFDLLHRLAFVYEWIKDGKEQDFALVSTRFGIPALNHPAWRAYYWLFTAPWFTRTWIVQEAAWAQDSEVMLGLFTFRWDSLVNSWDFLVQFGLLQPSFGNMALAKGLLRLRDILSVRNTCRAGFSNMLQVMRLTRDFDTTDARDKCFAVFSLVQEGQPVGQGFTPDYTLPVAEVYQQFAAYLVRKGEGANMFSYAGLQRRRDIRNISSWVPDWTLQSPSIAPKPLLKMRHTPYHAAGSTESCISMAAPLSRSHITIFVQGAVVDSIATLSEAHPIEDSLASVTSNLQMWHETTTKTYTTALEKKRLLYANPADAFARTLLADDTYTGANACQTTTPISDPALTHAQAMSAESPETPSSPSFCRDELDTFRLQVTAAGSGRRFAITTKGRMGLVPWCAEVGDGVCVVLGSGVLFVVRRGGVAVGKEAGTDEGAAVEEAKKTKGEEHMGHDESTKETWTLIGDAYVHDLMNGEALTEAGFTAREMEFC